jgi:hypothetical protein
MEMATAEGTRLKMEGDGGRSPTHEQILFGFFLASTHTPFGTFSSNSFLTLLLLLFSRSRCRCGRSSKNILKNAPYVPSCWLLL